MKVFDQTDDLFAGFNLIFNLDTIKEYNIEIIASYNKIITVQSL